VRIDHLSRLPVMPPSTFDVNWLTLNTINTVFKIIMAKWFTVMPKFRARLPFWSRIWRTLGYHHQNVRCKFRPNTFSSFGGDASRADKQTNSKLNISPLPRGDSNTNPAVRLLLVKFIKHNQKLLPKTLRFDLYQRPSSEEAGTQFFWFLTRREDGVSRKRSYALLSW